jgi:hypothetical protein
MLWPTTIAGMARTDFGFGFFSKQQVVIAYCGAPVPTQLLCGMRGRIAFLISKLTWQRPQTIIRMFYKFDGTV